jgi:hypothetical protein
VGNYNFISPYSHEASHSIALAVGVMVALFHGIRAGGRLPFALAGVLFGLLLLTRAETSLAMIAGVGLAFAGWLALDPGGRRFAVARLRLFLGFALMSLAAFAYFRSTCPLVAGCRCWGITDFSTTSAAQNAFYARWLARRAGAEPLQDDEILRGFLLFVAIAWWPTALAEVQCLQSAARRAMWRVARMR